MTTIVATRDGRQFVGCLKTYDQFGNVVLDRCVEKLTHPTDGDRFAEIYLGVILIRGENVTFFGTLDQPSAIKYQQNVGQIRSVAAPALPTAGTLKIPLNELCAAQERLNAEQRKARQLWTHYKNILAKVEREADTKTVLMAELNLRTDEEFTEAMEKICEARSILSDTTTDD